MNENSSGLVEKLNRIRTSKTAKIVLLGTAIGAAVVATGFAIDGVRDILEASNNYQVNDLYFKAGQLKSSIQPTLEAVQQIYDACTPDCTNSDFHGPIRNFLQNSDIWTEILYKAEAGLNRLSHTPEAIDEFWRIRDNAIGPIAFDVPHEFMSIARSGYIMAENALITPIKKISLEGEFYNLYSVAIDQVNNAARHQQETIRSGIYQIIGGVTAAIGLGSTALGINHYFRPKE